MWEEKNGRISLPTHTFGIGYVKEKINITTDILVDVSSTLSLLINVDLYWKSQLLVEYFKDLHIGMILDEMKQEEGYLDHEGVIYHDGRVLLFRASKLKKKILQGAHKEFLFNHMQSTKIYTLIMRSLDWEGTKGNYIKTFKSA